MVQEFILRWFKIYYMKQFFSKLEKRKNTENVQNDDEYVYILLKLQTQKTKLVPICASLFRDLFFLVVNNWHHFVFFEKFKSIKQKLKIDKAYFFHDFFSDHRNVKLH